MNKLSKGATRVTWIIAFLLFFLTSPYFFWQWYGNLFVNILISTVAMLLIWKYSSRPVGKQESILIFYVIVWAFFLFNEFVKGARMGVLAYVPYVLLGFVPFINKDVGKKIFNNFTTAYAILIGLSIFFWIAAMSNMISPIGQFGEEMADNFEREHRTYIVYPFALVAISDLSDFIRFCGFYNEAGVVGTLSGILLSAFRFNMKDWRCIILLLSGLLSTSMFFYGLAAVYWLSELLFVKKKVGYLLLVLIGVAVFYGATKNNEVVATLVWDRFEWNSQEGRFAGSSRGGEKEQAAMNTMIASGEIWFGVKDKDAYWRDNYGTSSIYSVYAMYGVIFVTLYIIWLLRVGFSYKKNNLDYLLFCFLIIGCMYQRPNIFSLPYTFLFVCAARYYEFEMNKKELSKEKKGRVRIFSK